jgi:imidazolonepropionase-like amidohydrolase
MRKQGPQNHNTPELAPHMQTSTPELALMHKYFARFAFRVSFVALIAMFAAAPCVLGQVARRTLITDVHIISPERLDHLELGSVLIENGRIARVERGVAIPHTGATTVVSGHGGFLIPGLMDSHVHLAFVPGVKPEVNFGPAANKPAMIAAYFTQLPRSYLYFGYTTVVDLAGVEPRVLDNFRHAPLHPDLYTCGHSLPLANGYPMALTPPGMGAALYPNFIDDPDQPRQSVSSALDMRRHTPAAAVAAVKRAGGICVKAYFDRGYGSSANLPVLSRDGLREIRDAAKHAGLVLVLHANSLEAQTFAVNGKVDVIAHGMWNWGALNAQPQLPPEIAAVLDVIAQRRIGYQPTMQVTAGFRAYFDSTYLQSPTIRKVVPSEMVAWFNSDSGAWFKRELTENGASDAVMRRAYDQGPSRRARQAVTYLATKDAVFLFGTDTPAAPSYGNLPGMNQFLEMQQLRQAGLSLEQILKAATINNAKAFGLDAQIGTIETGKAANLVLLERSPLESVDAYDRIVAVWVHGTYVARNRLAASPH